MPPVTASRAWQVLLVGGPSAVGKTTVAYRLAARYGIGITEIDDLHQAARAMTTAREQPLLHEADAWRRLSEDGRLARMLAVSEALAPAIAAVVAQHIEARVPVVLEGDFLLPALAADLVSGGGVRAIFLDEGDEGRIARNLEVREGRAQAERARASWRHGQWLRGECMALGLPLVPARPRQTVLERCVAAIGG